MDWGSRSRVEARSPPFAGLLCWELRKIAFHREHQELRRHENRQKTFRKRPAVPQKQRSERQDQRHPRDPCAPGNQKNPTSDPEIPEECLWAVHSTHRCHLTYYRSISYGQPRATAPVNTTKAVPNAQTSNLLASFFAIRRRG